MKITRVYADDAGESHFATSEISLADAGDIGELSEAFDATAVTFRQNAADYDFDWHHAPRRQLIVLLDGAIEIEVSDGERRRFQGGDVLLVEDTHGRGHKTKSIVDQPRRSIFIHLPDGSLT